MPKSKSSPASAKDIPDALRPFESHGVEWKVGSKESRSTSPCPLCGDGEKFYAANPSGAWSCKKCGRSGNATTFLRQLHELSTSRTTAADYSWLSAHRGLPEFALREWGIVRSVATGEWLVPAYFTGGGLGNLYRYVPESGGKWVLYGTAGVGVAPTYRVGSGDGSDADVFVTEGVWDGIRLWCALKSAKRSGRVISVPGTHAFPREWAERFTSKTVTILFDNDHARVAGDGSGTVKDGPGFLGTKHTAALLVNSASPPASVRYLHWGDGGWADQYPDGHDVRDWFSAGGTLGGLLGMVRDAPASWGEDGAPADPAGGRLTAKPCTSWAVLEDACRKSMHWTAGQAKTTAVVLAASASMYTEGDQVWVKIISPPSTGKTTAVEGLEAAGDEYVIERSDMKGFYSGYVTDKEGEEDYSLAAAARGKTLVTKDGDSLLSSPFAPQVMGQARDLFDGKGGKGYLNGVTREYRGHRMVWVICVTPESASLDNNSLGARFLDCRIMTEIDPETEDAMVMASLQRSRRGLKATYNCKPESRADALTIEARRLTGGYLVYLRRNAERLMAELDLGDDLPLKECASLGKLVAFLRARPPESDETEPCREAGPRPANQLYRLAACLALVMNRKTIDEEVMVVVRSVAMDTCRGRTLEIVRVIRDSPNGRLTGDEVAGATGQNRLKELRYLNFLRDILAVDYEVDRKTMRARWFLTPYFKSVYDAVTGVV